MRFRPLDLAPQDQRAGEIGLHRGGEAQVRAMFGQRTAIQNQGKGGSGTWPAARHVISRGNNRLDTNSPRHRQQEADSGLRRDQTAGR